jgi:electron transfer flavoprotein alpha subunit
MRVRPVELDEDRLLDNAPVVICIGEQLDEHGVEAARRLAAVAEGGLGATPHAVEAGLADSQLEISVLKRSMSPPLLVALGVREDEELDAVRAARRLVTVEPDPEAPAHARADLAIVAQPDELVSAALERLGG